MFFQISIPQQKRFWHFNATFWTIFYFKTINKNTKPWKQLQAQIFEWTTYYSKKRITYYLIKFWWPLFDVPISSSKHFKLQNFVFLCASRSEKNSGKLFSFLFKFSKNGKWLFILKITEDCKYDKSQIKTYNQHCFVRLTWEYSSWKQFSWF